MDIVSVLLEALLLYAPGTLVAIVAAFLVGFVLAALMPAVATWTVAVARPEMVAASPLENVVAPAATTLLSGLLVGRGAAGVVGRKRK